MSDEANHHISDAYLSAVKAVTEAARRVDEASQREAEAEEIRLQYFLEKREADKALRAALAELQKAENEEGQ